MKKRVSTESNLRFSRNARKRAQQSTEMPFGIIFAVFLIVIFVVIAFNATKSFLDVGKCASIGMFYDELQTEVDKVWASESSEQNFTMKLPTGITKICFANLSNTITNKGEDYNSISIYDFQDANVFLLPAGKTCDMQYKKINHINITTTTSKKNPLCIDVARPLKLKQGFYEKSVTIE